MKRLWSWVEWPEVGAVHWPLPQNVQIANSTVYTFLNKQTNTQQFRGAVFYNWDPPTQSWSSTFFCLLACFSSFPTLHSHDKGSLFFLFQFPPPSTEDRTEGLLDARRAPGREFSSISVTPQRVLRPLFILFHRFSSYLHLRQWLIYFVSLCICHFLCLFQINRLLQYAILWLESFTQRIFEVHQLWETSVVCSFYVAQ